MPVSARFNIDGRYVGSAADRARYFAKWARYARLYAAGVGVGALRLAGGVGLAGTAAYAAYRYMAKKRGASGHQSIRAPKRARGTGVRSAPLKRTRPVAMRRVRRRNVTKRGRKVAPSRPGGQIRFTKMRFGKKRPMTLRKLTKIALERRVLRWQNVAPMDRGVASDFGAMRLTTGFYTNTTIASAVNALGYIDNNYTAPVLSTNSTAAMRCPVHCYLLNGTIDGAQAQTGAGNSAPVALQLFINNDGPGVVNFSNLFGAIPSTTSPFVTAQLGWGLEKTSGFFDSNTIETHRVRYTQNDWYDIRLCLRNATAQKCWYDIMIVQFKEDCFDPIEAPNSDPVQIQDRHAFWYGLAREGASHPLVQNNNMQRAMSSVRVLKRTRVLMDPNDNQQADATPNMRVVKLFYRDGVMNDYQTVNRADVIGELHGGPLINPNVYEPQGRTTGEYELQPNPKARKWLIIRAFDPSPIASAAAGGFDTSETVTNTPTYDIILRKHETRFPELSNA